jgi:hypothetical protein
MAKPTVMLVLFLSIAFKTSFSKRKKKKISFCGPIYFGDKRSTTQTKQLMDDFVSRKKVRDFFNDKRLFFLSYAHLRTGLISQCQFKII